MRYFLFLPLVLTSCLTVGRIERNCDKFAKICTTDSQITTEIVYRDSIVYRDTTIYDTIAGDTVYVDKPIPVPGSLTVPPLFAQVEFARASAGVTASRLWLQLEQKDTVRLKTLVSALKDATYWKEKYINEKQTITITERYTPKHYIIAFWAWVVVLVCGVLWLWFKLLN